MISDHPRRGLLLAAGAMAGLSAIALSAAPEIRNFGQIAGDIYNTQYVAPRTDMKRPMNVNAFSSDTLMRLAMASGAVVSDGTFVKHRAAGERAHRRWRHARASGRHNANRG